MEFILAATIHANADGIYNDDKYQVRADLAAVSGLARPRGPRARAPQAAPGQAHLRRFSGRLVMTNVTSAASAAGLLIALATGACVDATQPTRPVTSIDVLDFIVGDDALWPRIGNHYSNQIVDVARREVCWVNYANPQRFECWRWDETFVYHAVDHAVDGDTGELVQLHGRSVAAPLPDRRRVDSGYRREPHHMVRSAVRGVGGEIGSIPGTGSAPGSNLASTRAAISASATSLSSSIRRTTPASGRSATERFQFARGAGWYRWQRDGVDLQFNRRGGPRVPMNRAVWCGGL